MTRQIFRKEALDRLASPEQLDQLMQLTSPRGWIALASLGLLLVTALLWGFFGSFADTVEGQGFLLPSDDPRPVDAPYAGVVTELRVKVGDEIKKGQPLLVLDAPSAAGPALLSPFPGRVLAVAVKKGERVKEGTTLLTLDTLQAVLYVPAADGYRVEPDMPAQVWPAPVKRGEFGALRGTVTRAAKFPANREELLRRLQNEDLVNSLAGTGPFLEIVVQLEPDATSVSGYKWSSAKGPALTLYGGTPCQGQITFHRHKPIELVFPFLHLGES
jgi:biotin carboxyl carrier protein